MGGEGVGIRAGGGQPRTHKSVESFMDKGHHIYSEARLAKFINLPRKMMSDMRNKVLTEDEEWTNRGGEIALNLKGALRLLQAFGLPETDVRLSHCFIQSIAEKKNDAGVPLRLLLCAPGSAPSPIKMRVKRIFPNPRLIEAQEVARPLQTYQVLVPSNGNFVIGMEFQAVPDPANAGFWRLHGMPPRYRGRW